MPPYAKIIAKSAYFMKNGIYLRLRTKEEFEKALFKLLEEKNYHDITVSEICALTNKTKMTFYRNYKDKDALLAIASINLINNEYNIEYS